MFMPHFALLLVRIGYSYISLFVERFVSTLISFMAPSFLSLWSPVHFWRKKVWSFEAAVTFPVRSVLGLVVYLSSPRHDIRPTAATTFPKNKQLQQLQHFYSIWSLGFKNNTNKTLTSSNKDSHLPLREAVHVGFPGGNWIFVLNKGEGVGGEDSICLGGHCALPVTYLSITVLINIRACWKKWLFPIMSLEEGSILLPQKIISFRRKK